MGVRSDEAVKTKLEEENYRLRRAVEELSVLNDLSRAIGASLDLTEIMQTIVRRSTRALHAEQGVVTLVEPEDDSSLKTLVRTRITQLARPAFHLDQCLTGWMQLNRKPLVIHEPRTDPRFPGVRWDDSVRSLLSVPLLVKSRLTGLLTVFNKTDSGQFSEEDQRLLSIIAGQSAQIIDNARLYEQEKALIGIQEEIRNAARIQHELLPKSFPDLRGFDIAGKTVPARSVGGDYFDFIPITEDAIGICIADVSGKGLPAAMLMANIQATLRGQMFFHPSAADCVERSNRLLFHSTDDEKFATLFLCMLNSGDASIRYCNAGHNPPLLYTPGKGFARLSQGGFVLGIIEDADYSEGGEILEPGSVLTAYSDGITEALDDREEEFGEERLLNLVRENTEASAIECCDRVLQAIVDFTGSSPQSDDRTIVVVKRVSN